MRYPRTETSFKPSLTLLNPKPGPRPVQDLPLKASNQVLGFRNLSTTPHPSRPKAYDLLAFTGIPGPCLPGVGQTCKRKLCPRQPPNTSALVQGMIGYDSLNGNGIGVSPGKTAGFQRKRDSAVPSRQEPLPLLQSIESRISFGTIEHRALPKGQTRF